MSLCIQIICITQWRRLTQIKELKRGVIIFSVTVIQERRVLGVSNTIMPCSENITATYENGVCRSFIGVVSGEGMTLPLLSTGSWKMCFRVDKKKRGVEAKKGSGREDFLPFKNAVLRSIYICYYSVKYMLL